MLKKRYSFVIADRSSGAVRRFTLAVRPALTMAIGILAFPVGLMIQTYQSASAEIEQLQVRNDALESENHLYRAATTDLSGRITALQLAAQDLHDRSIVKPQLQRAMERLAEIDGANGAASLRTVALNPSTEAFGLLHDLLNVLDLQLGVANVGVTQREALAAAAPLNLPADGPVTGRFGYRSDPFTGQRSYHPAIDISTDYGQPVVATADGSIVSAERSGAYGNLIEIDHGFSRTTRYGHLSKFAIAVGDQVKRGQVIGFAGATGRATGSHVHYEVSVADRAVNPLQLTSTRRSASAD